MQGAGTVAKMRSKELIVGAIVAGMLIVAGIVKTFLASDSDAAVTREVPNVSFDPTKRVSTTMKIHEEKEAVKVQKALEAIAEHEAKILANRSAKDTPDRLMAVGNLYQYQVGDYYSAIRNYRALVDEYPAHRQIPQAYIEIAACFERMGEPEQAMYVYREMVEKLDPSLQHVLYAKQRLEGANE
ncbi:MAG: hypothetical protein Kow0099_23280 [Candidatus Abyssubacteria bacterium]